MISRRHRDELETRHAAIELACDALADGAEPANRHPHGNSSSEDVAHCIAPGGRTGGTGRPHGIAVGHRGATHGLRKAVVPTFRSVVKSAPPAEVVTRQARPRCPEGRFAMIFREEPKRDVDRHRTDRSFASGDGDLGRWLPKRFRKRRAEGRRVSMRLPGVMRNHHVAPLI